MPIKSAKEGEVEVRLHAEYVAAIKKVAREKKVPYKSLMQTWVVEKLWQEAPELIPQEVPIAEHQHSDAS